MAINNSTNKDDKDITTAPINIKEENEEDKTDLKKILEKEIVKTMLKDIDSLRDKEEAKIRGKISGEKNDATTKEEEIEMRKTIEEAGNKKTEGVILKPLKMETAQEIKPLEETEKKMEEEVDEKNKKTDEEIDRDTFLKIKAEVEREIGKEQPQKEENIAPKAPTEKKQAIMETKKEWPPREISMEEKKVLLNQTLEKILTENQPTEDKKKKILIAIERLEKGLLSILEREKAAEEERGAAEEEEKAAQSPSRKKSAEEKRWRIEEGREAIEKERWDSESKINELEEELDTLNLENEKSTEKKIKIEKELRNISLLEEKNKAEKDIEKIEEKTSALEKEIEDFNKKENAVVLELSQIIKKEKEIEDEMENLEQKEKAAAGEKEREAIEKQRWEIAKERREIEKKKWETQERKEAVEMELEKLRPVYQKLSDTREKLELQIKEIDNSLLPALRSNEKEQEAVKTTVIETDVKAEVNIEVKKEEPVTTENTEKKNEKSQITAIEEPKKQKHDWEEEDRKEFLKQFKNKLEERKETIPTTPRESKRSYGEEIKIEDLPSPEPIIKSSSNFKKIFIRGVIIILVFFVFGAIYWIFTINKKGNEDAIKKETPVIIIEEPKEELKEEEPKEEEEEETKEKPASIALFPINETFTAETLTDEDIIKSYGQFLTQKHIEGNFVRILIKNTKEKKWSGLKEISSVFQIEIPSEILNKIEDDFTIAAYNQKQGKRLALAVKIRKGETLTTEMRNWEKNIKTNGLLINKKKVPSIAASFRDSTYKGEKIRFLTISTQDLGVCYAIINDTLIITSSYNSIEKLIEIYLINKL